MIRCLVLITTGFCSLTISRCILVVKTTLLRNECGTGAAVINSQNVPDGTGIIWLDDVRCNGDEARLFDCPASALGVSDCAHLEDTGVRCDG